VETNLSTTTSTANSALTEARAADSRIDGVDSLISTLTTDVTTLESGVTNAQNSASSAVSQAQTANSRIDTVEGDVTAVAGQITTLEAEVAGLDNASLQSSITENANAISTLETQQASTSTELNTLGASVSDADGLLDDEFSRHSYVSDDSGDIAVAPDTIQQFPALAMTLERGGVYRYTFYLGYRAQTFPSTRDIRLLVSSGVTDAITFSSSTASTKYAKDAVFLRDSTFAFQPSIPATQVSVGILQFTDDGVGRGEPVKIEGVIEISNTIATATADLQLIISYTSENNQNLNLFDSRKLIYEKIN